MTTRLAALAERARVGAPSGFVIVHPADLTALVEAASAARDLTDVTGEPWGGDLLLDRLEVLRAALAYLTRPV